MGPRRAACLPRLSVLVLPALVCLLQPGEAEAGPLVRRAQERRACQEFAARLQQASGNPSMAQQVYQQGVLQLVSRFGENPCGDIPAPTAVVTPANPAATTSPGAAPAGTSPAATAAPAVAPASPAAASSGAASATGGTAAAASPQQQQACQQFAGKLQAAAASGGAAAAQQTYAMGMQKLSGMFGPNPCPAVQAPQ
jgi:hypothetical protein